MLNRGNSAVLPCTHRYPFYELPLKQFYFSAWIQLFKIYILFHSINLERLCCALMHPKYKKLKLTIAVLSKQHFSYKYFIRQ